MNNTKKGDSGAKLIFGNEEWDEKPFFLISLIEYKSRVDYNVIMQLCVTWSLSGSTMSAK